MIRRGKLLEIAAESPASGARFVRQLLFYPNDGRKKTPPLTSLTFTHNFDSGNDKKITRTFAKKNLKFFRK